MLFFQNQVAFEVHLGTHGLVRVFEVDEFLEIGRRAGLFGDDPAGHEVQDVEREEHHDDRAADPANRPENQKRPRNQDDCADFLEEEGRVDLALEADYLHFEVGVKNDECYRDCGLENEGGQESGQ